MISPDYTWEPIPNTAYSMRLVSPEGQIVGFVGPASEGSKSPSAASEDAVADTSYWRARNQLLPDVKKRAIGIFTTKEKAKEAVEKSIAAFNAS